MNDTTKLDERMNNDNGKAKNDATNVKVPYGLKPEECPICFDDPRPKHFRNSNAQSKCLGCPPFRFAMSVGLIRFHSSEQTSYEVPMSDSQISLSSARMVLLLYPVFLSKTSRATVANIAGVIV
jgi:hypothetical protein